MKASRKSLITDEQYVSGALSSCMRELERGAWREAALIAAPFLSARPDEFVQIYYTALRELGLIRSFFDLYCGRLNPCSPKAEVREALRYLREDGGKGTIDDRRTLPFPTFLSLEHEFFVEAFEAYENADVQRAEKVIRRLMTTRNWMSANNIRIAFGAYLRSELPQKLLEDAAAEFPKNFTVRRNLAYGVVDRIRGGAPAATFDEREFALALLSPWKNSGDALLLQARLRFLDGDFLEAAKLSSAAFEAKPTLAEAELWRRAALSKLGPSSNDTEVQNVRANTRRMVREGRRLWSELWRAKTRSMFSLKSKHRYSDAL